MSSLYANSRPRSRAGDRREHEQRDDAGAAGKADNESGHSGTHNGRQTRRYR